ncbi:DUF5060 domain-containing protein [uncultured Draconibacterium sp.]|uniref:DUF5060 domain-containing protein n=1 Tax=uncultured Draconibacterium sp. TaxID=1573823 RepID=UPI003216F7A0
MKRYFFTQIALLIFFTGFTQQVKKTAVEQWDVYEIVLNGPSSGNPYMDVDIGAVFTNNKKSLAVPGFYDGNGVFRIRFSPAVLGTWSYQTVSNSKKLANKTGSFKCVPATGNNHGPVKIVNTYYLGFSDGTPFYSIGTTAYQWTSVDQSIQDKTISTLAKSPFNKMRMCVFPKHYYFGNNTEPWAYPYERNDTINDFTKPNFEFFQNFDRRVKQLNDLGIQADVILFHPYDKWGYSKMGGGMNEKYVRYMIARLSAYRNVWWSLANEWDDPRIKETIDWDGIGSLLQREDPHKRLRGIHNWYHDESHFYDHTRPWVTHVSAQTYYFFNAIKWRNKYQKPVLFDEMRYEGDVPSGWGRLTGKEMTDYFWKAGLSGVYGVHGETFKNNSDDKTEVRWWAKGGTLMGESPERIAFFKKIMEAAPVNEMIPKLVSLSGLPVPENIPDKNDGKLVEELNNNIYTLCKEGEYYLTYTTDSARTIDLNLGGTKDYSLEVIDTWNMKTVSQKVVSPGKFQYKTKIPNTILRLVAKQ